MIAAVEHIRPRIRRMRHADVADVAEIERATYGFPWSPGIFRDCLLAGYNSVVLESGSEIIGYGIVSIAAGEAHVLNICISRGWQNRGHGYRLLDFLLSQAHAAGAARVFLEVRPSNQAARRLYRKAGFEVIGVRKDYYRADGGNEDAVVLLHCVDDGR